MSYDQETLSALSEDEKLRLAIAQSLVENAKFIGESYKDGTKVDAGRNFVKMWWVANCPTGAYLGLVGSKNGFGVGKVEFSRDSRRCRISLELTAPKKPGNARINFAIFTSSGEKLLSLWCKVEVMNSSSELDEKAMPTSDGKTRDSALDGPRGASQEGFREIIARQKDLLKAKDSQIAQMKESIGLLRQSNALLQDEMTREVKKRDRVISGLIDEKKALREENGSIRKKFESLRKAFACLRNEMTNVVNVADVQIVSSQGDD